MRAALEAATQLPFEIRRQLNIANKARAAALLENSIPPAIGQAEYNPAYGMVSNDTYHPMGQLEDSMRFTELSPASDASRPLTAERNEVNSIPMYNAPLAGQAVYQPLVAPGHGAPHNGHGQHGHTYPANDYGLTPANNGYYDPRNPPPEAYPYPTSVYGYSGHPVAGNVGTGWM